jgi:hypothetical protein
MAQWGQPQGYFIDWSPTAIVWAAPTSTQGANAARIMPVVGDHRVMNMTCIDAGMDQVETRKCLCKYA